MSLSRVLTAGAVVEHRLRQEFPHVDVVEVEAAVRVAMSAVAGDHLLAVAQLEEAARARLAYAAPGPTP